VKPKPPVVKPKVPKRTGPARNVKEARRLISEARGHVGRTEFEEAKAKYGRVVKSRFLNQMGYLGLSDVAFQEKDGKKAIKYAKKAGKSAKARMALGNAYFKQGNYRESLKIFNGVLDKNPGHKEAQSHAKAARQKLKK
jgi:tetratricopeptide (TPR) repeat protein